MNKSEFRDYAQRASKAAAKHWAWSSACTLLILAGLIWSVGWLAAGVLAQFFVALIALGGYVFSYYLYREQEAHKYRPLLTTSFQNAPNEVRQNLQGWMPGFSLTFEGQNAALKTNFTLENISASPVTDVRMNFYFHDYRKGSKPSTFFEHDVPLADGIAGNSGSLFGQVLRFHRIQSVEDAVLSQALGGGKQPAFRFSDLFLSLIPSPKRDEPARLSAWSLVFKYTNLLGESFFSVYKMEGPVVREESSRMVFHGSFAGNYFLDDDEHKFVQNRGFRNKEDAPDWDGVQAAVEDAMRRAENFRSALDAEIRGGSSGRSAW